jgi:protein-S-isoprenylcysteine O-methyltransferase Ste14
MVSPMSSRSAKAAALLKTLIFSVLVPGTVAACVPYRILSAQPESAPLALGAARFVGIPLMVLGALGYLWCAWDFATKGLGTPAPIDPPRTLVAQGLYRHVRNPMYVSVLLVLLGESLFFESRRLLLYAGVVWLIVHSFVLAYEEPTLRRKFGAAYEEYRRRVPRWLPRFR